MPAIPKQLISAGFLILQGRPNVESFLLMRHPRRWDLPKGHLDPGETILECAYRELEEETGIAADQVEHLADFRFETSYEVRYKKFGNAPLPKTTVIFLGRLPERVDIRLTEHPEYRWWPWAPPHAIQLETIDPLLREVEAYLARLT